MKGSLYIGLLTNIIVTKALLTTRLEAHVTYMCLLKYQNTNLRKLKQILIFDLVTSLLSAWVLEFLVNLQHGPRALIAWPMYEDDVSTLFQV